MSIGNARTNRKRKLGRMFHTHTNPWWNSSCWLLVFWIGHDTTYKYNIKSPHNFMILTCDKTKNKQMAPDYSIWTMTPSLILLTCNSKFRYQWHFNEIGTSVPRRNDMLRVVPQRLTNAQSHAHNSPLAVRFLPRRVPLLDPHTLPLPVLDRINLILPRKRRPILPFPRSLAIRILIY